MSRGKAEVFTCDVCGNKQTLNTQAVKSITCIGCLTEFAIVADDEGNKATVPYFLQKKAGRSCQGS